MMSKRPSLKNYNQVFSFCLNTGDTSLVYGWFGETGFNHAVNVNFPGVSTTDQCAGSQHEDQSSPLTDIVGFSAVLLAGVGFGDMLGR